MDNRVGCGGILWGWSRTFNLYGWVQQAGTTRTQHKSKLAMGHWNHVMACTMPQTIKVCGPHVATLLNWTPTFEWCLTRLVLVKNVHTSNKIGLSAQSSTIKVGSIVNTIWKTCVITQWERESSPCPLITVAYTPWFWHKLKWNTVILMQNCPGFLILVLALQMLHTTGQRWDWGSYVVIVFISGLETIGCQFASISYFLDHRCLRWCVPLLQWPPLQWSLKFAQNNRSLNGIYKTCWLPNVHINLPIRKHESLWTWHKGCPAQDLWGCDANVETPQPDRVKNHVKNIISLRWLME